MNRREYVDRVTSYVLPKEGDLREAVLERRTLERLYLGTSAKIHRLIRIAWGRGVRAGASMAWSAMQPVTTRSMAADTVPVDRAALERLIEISTEMNGPNCELLFEYDRWAERLEEVVDQSLRKSLVSPPQTIVGVLATRNPNDCPWLPALLRGAEGDRTPYL